jgi:hypothetical protein
MIVDAQVRILPGHVQHPHKSAGLADLLLRVVDLAYGCDVVGEAGWV